MARLVERVTGSVVNVPDEKVGQVLALGLYDREAKSEKAPAKAASDKSDK